MIQTVQNAQTMRPAEAAALFDVHPGTLARWAAEGRIRVLMLPSGQRRYYRAELERLATEGSPQEAS